jgi:hypothetical protein
MGNEIPEPVKDKIKKLLYSWKVGLPNETKIADAFEMLKKQGKPYIYHTVETTSLMETPYGFILYQR